MMKPAPGLTPVVSLESPPCSCTDEDEDATPGRLNGKVEVAEDSGVFEARAQSSGDLNTVDRTDALPTQNKNNA